MKPKMVKQALAVTTPVAQKAPSLEAQIAQLTEIIAAVIDVVGAQTVIAQINMRKAEREAAQKAKATAAKKA